MATSGTNEGEGPSASGMKPPSEPRPHVLMEKFGFDMWHA